MKITTDMLTQIFPQLIASKGNVVADSINKYGSYVGIDLPHRLAMFLAQTGHESMEFSIARELWGPTDQQKKYDPSSGSKLSKELGNTIVGDGRKYRGYGYIQLTGKKNVTNFNNWCTKAGITHPNFVNDPSQIGTPPWDMVSALYYWGTTTLHNQHINAYADRGDMEMVSRAVNGGLNGYGDRLRLYDRAALVLLGYKSDDIRGLQAKAGIVVDGISGPRTRAAMHAALLSLTTPKDKPAVTSVAPVVDASTAKSDVDKPLIRHPGVLAGLASVGTTVGNVASSAMADYRTAIVFAVLTVIILIVFLVFLYLTHKKDLAKIDKLVSENIFGDNNQ